jgi:hypothetical protein
LERRPEVERVGFLAVDDLVLVRPGGRLNSKASSRSITALR